MNTTRSSFKSWLTHFPSSKALALPLSAVLSLALLVALTLTSFAASAVPAGAASTKAPTKVVISKVAVSGTKVTVTGRVVPPASASSSSTRSQTSVALSLSGVGKTERFSAKLDSKWRFKATKSTKLTGQLTVAALARIAGKPAGEQVRKRFRGPQAKTTGNGGPAAGKGGSGGSGSGGSTRPVGVPLIGTFKLDPGVEHPDGSHTGTYFRMLTPGNKPGGPDSSYLVNGDSKADNKTYTLLKPGTDGGLRTNVFQPAPVPAFDGSGAALASRIVQPTKFFGQYFSIVTEALDPQANVADPVPAIANDGGKLSGQVTAWAAQWNNNSFNQGTPKPDGTLPGSTVPLSGTYDPVSGHYVIEWFSLIVSGPFDTFGGYWHLEGSFQPA